MIAYDFDGIFISDIIFIGNLKVPEYTINTLPLFQPTGDYCIITSRAEKDKEYTFTFIDDKFKIKPVRVFHKCCNPSFGAQYKTKVLNENPDITVFIESCKTQYEYIKKNLTRTDCKVIHFSTLIQDTIGTL